jgi:hypothetical protein
LTDLEQEFAQAARARGGGVERHLSIWGMPVRLRFASDSTADVLGRAFEHLERDKESSPALTLHVWDAATTRTGRPAFAPPSAGPEDRDPSAAGASYFFESAEYRALHQPASDSLSVLARAGDMGWFWVPDARELPYWDYTAPFRHLLAWWLSRRGCRLVHAAAVGDDRGGVLLVGRGGSGKSTASLSVLFDDRLRFAGDDYVAIGAGDDHVRAHSLYSFAKLHWRDLARLPQLASAISNGGRRDEKAVFHVYANFPDRCTNGFPLRAVVVPRVKGGATRVGSSNHAKAVAALAPSTIFQIYPPAPDALAQIAGIVRALPTFSLELGADVEAIPSELLRLIEGLA